MKKDIDILALILIPIAVICFVSLTIGGLITLKHVREYKETPAVVTKVSQETSYDIDGTSHLDTKIYVDYSVDGQNYSYLYTDNMSSPRPGQIVIVRYDPKDPSKCTNDTVGKAVIQFFAAAFGAFVPSFILIRSRKNRRKKESEN